MKKSFFAIVFAFLSAFTFLGCHSDDDENDEIKVVLQANGGTMTNGDSGSTEKKTYTLKIGGSLRLSAEDVGLTRDGYAIKGWAESADVTEVKYYDTLSYTFTKNTTLYAVWKVADNTKIYYISESGDNTTGDGSESKPFATLGKASEQITEYSSSEDNYIFYISGNISDSASFSDGIYSLGAKSITILGKTGATSDSISGKNTGSILSVQTKVPISVKKLTLTGGKGSSFTNEETIGGAVYISHEKASVFFSEVYFSENSATYGGAVYSVNGTVKFASCVFSKNVATVSGGAIQNEVGTLTVNGGSFSENSSQTAGAIYNKSSLTMGSVKIAKNKAESYGAGIYNVGTANLTSVTISENSADYAAGIYNKGDSFTFAGGTISENSAKDYAAGIYNEGTFYLAGGELDGNSLSGTETYGAAIYNKGTFSIRANATIKNHTAKNGGAFYNDSDGNFSFTSGTISQNSAENGGGVYNLGTMNLDGGAVSKNTASSSGGGIYNAKALTITNGEISENTSSENGGGLSNVGSSASCSFTYGKINDNTAKNGGGVYNEEAAFTMSEGTADKLTGLYGLINDNAATSFGGGIYLKSGSLSVTKGVISAYGGRKTSSTSSTLSYYGNKAGKNKGTEKQESYSEAGNAWYREADAKVELAGTEQNETLSDADVAISVSDWTAI